MSAEAVEKIRDAMARRVPLVTDKATLGPCPPCPCERHTVERELRAAGYWLGPGVIWVPPGGSVELPSSPLEPFVYRGPE